MVEEKGWQERVESLAPGFSISALLTLCLCHGVCPITPALCYDNQKCLQTFITQCPWVDKITLAECHSCSVRKNVRYVDEVGDHGMEVGKSSSLVRLT